RRGAGRPPRPPPPAGKAGVRRPRGSAAPPASRARMNSRRVDTLPPFARSAVGAPPHDHEQDRRHFAPRRDLAKNLQQIPAERRSYGHQKEANRVPPPAQQPALWSQGIEEGREEHARDEA